MLASKLAEISVLMSQLGISNINNKKIIEFIDKLDQPVATHHHIKSDGDYNLIGYGRMQAEYWVDLKPYRFMADSTQLLLSEIRFNKVDMQEVAQYQSLKDGSLWSRVKEEFDDGRFKEI